MKKMFCLEEMQLAAANQQSYDLQNDVCVGVHFLPRVGEETNNAYPPLPPTTLYTDDICRPGVSLNFNLLIALKTPKRGIKVLINEVAKS